MSCLPRSPGRHAPAVPSHIRLWSEEEEQFFGLIPELIWALPDLSLRAKVVLGALSIMARGARDIAWATIQQVSARCGLDDRTTRRGLADLCRANVLDLDQLDGLFRLKFRLKLRGRPRQVEGARREHDARTGCAHQVPPLGTPFKEEKRENETDGSPACACDPPEPSSFLSIHQEDPTVNNTTESTQATPATPPSFCEVPPRNPEPEEIRRHVEAQRGERTPGGRRNEVVAPPSLEDLVAMARRFWPKTPDLEARIKELRDMGPREAALAIEYAGRHGATAIGYVFVTRRRWFASGYNTVECENEVMTSRPRSQRRSVQQNLNPKTPIRQMTREDQERSNAALDLFVKMLHAHGAERIRLREEMERLGDGCQETLPFVKPARVEEGGATTDGAVAKLDHQPTQATLWRTSPPPPPNTSRAHPEPKE